MKRFLKILGCIALASILTACATSGRQTESEKGLKPSRISDLIKPATVLIQVNFKARVGVPDLTITEKQLNTLRDKILVKVRRGEIGRSEEEIKVAAINEFLMNPMNYITPSGNIRTVETGVTSQGSGLIITPDGYVVTNAHVAAPHMDMIKRAMAQQGLTSFVNEDVQDMRKELEGASTPQMEERFKQIAMAFYEQYMQVGPVEKTAFASMGANLPGVAVMQKQYPSEVAMVIGEPIPGKDVAILKMEGGTNFPTIPLGDDTALQNGDRLYVMGYPAAATFHPLLSTESVTEPTFTSGLVSARKTMSGGWQVIQMDAAITHGNSGGPVVNDAGQVIGIATFGSISEGGQEIAGMNFVVPTTVVNQFLERNNIKPSTGIVSTKYAQALEQYDRQHYKHALSLFQEVNALSPGHPYVQQYVSRTQSEITQGKDRSWEDYLWAYITAAVVLITILIVVVILLITRRGTDHPTTFTPSRV